MERAREEKETVGGDSEMSESTLHSLFIVSLSWHFFIISAVSHRPENVDTLALKSYKKLISLLHPPENSSPAVRRTDRQPRRLSIKRQDLPP